MIEIPFEGLNVSRETYDDLLAYHDLLTKWTPRINLVSKSSRQDLWNRHIWDSAQLMLLNTQGKHWVDIGSGGGLPALVVAIFAKSIDPSRRVTMIESDQRKSTFLRTVIRELDLNARVEVTRVEHLAPQNADILSARALADLSSLFEYSRRHLAPSGTALFMKGETWEKEVKMASESWSFNLQPHKSKTSLGAAILEIKDIERV